ncbi:PREDICTED: opioid growth factor receptor [Crocodylus porosus]|uniref:opioid growth factor receptor n=1 Tax=Crocodylus porosus TaxID=8502 RepID=UPI0009400C55|nr:PREDICTED: opioid growth factor receptor [Crocodylus porosus]
MAAWLGMRPPEDAEGEDGQPWQYDSSWEDEGEGGQEGLAEEKEDGDEEKPMPVCSRGCSQAGGWLEQRRTNVPYLSQRGFEFSAGRNWRAAKDLQRYRHHYPGLEESEADEEEEEMWNLSFYKNEINFKPRGVSIDTLLKDWCHDYEMLEENHSYIQWLFPLRERGMNWQAKPLTCKEIQAFKNSEEVMQRFIKAYELMLGFYGITLANRETGEVKRAENWEERFRNLDRFSHNNLRITRILKCLGEMEYEHYQVCLVKFFLTETLVNETLPNVKRSALDYFLFTIRNKQKRRELIHYAWRHFKPQSRFVWGPHQKLLKYRCRPSKSQCCQKTEEEQEPVRGKKREAGGKDESKLNGEERAGDAADLQTRKVTEDHESEKLSEHDHTADKGDAEEETQALLPQLEERDPGTEALGLGDKAENDYLKESKKRKLDKNSKCTGLLKSPTDIEKISHNLGECVLNQENTEPLPALQKCDAPVMTEEDSVDMDSLMEPESSDAAVKRRKVDEMTPENEALNTAINLNAEASPCSVQVTSPDSGSQGAEEEEASEEKQAVEESSVQTLCSAELPGSEVGLPSPGEDDSMPSRESAKIESDDSQPNKTLPGTKSQADGLGLEEVAKDVNIKREDKASGGVHSQATPLEERTGHLANAGNITQETDGSGDSAEPSDLKM